MKMNLHLKQYAPILVIALSTLTWPAHAPAQCIIIVPPMPPRRRPMPPRWDHHTLTVANQSFTSVVTDGVAVTKVDQTFHNPYPHRIEGTYLFPLPDDASVSGFSMFLNGHEIEGKLLDRDEARRTYEGIVASLRDPALLEYVGLRLYKARIFPIEPNADVRVVLRYTQTLQFDAGLATLTFPLRGDIHSARPAGSTSVLVKIHSRIPIKSAFSPTHDISVNRPSEYEASISFESKNLRATRDFVLHYALSEKEFGLTMLSYRNGAEDGFFMARIAPKAKIDPGDVIPKDICFVFDTSGSMSGKKIEQARDALKYCLNHLNAEDRFNIIPFAHEPRPFASKLLPASSSNVQDATRFVEKMTAEGGTNINDALLAALKSAPNANATNPYLIVFLTDGLPTVGENKPEKIITNVAEANTSRVRLFVFGVGHDVNTELLDRLAEENRGTRQYVQPAESIEVKLSSFYRKVADPVLSDLKLTWGGLDVYDSFPQQLPDLFSGGEIVVVGRYKGDGGRSIELSGARRGGIERHEYEYTFPAHNTQHEFLPRLWAIRKIGYLLDEIRLHGDNTELKDTIVRLAKRYGIVTPYTSYLVTEETRVARRRGHAAFTRDYAADAAFEQPANDATVMRALGLRRGRGGNGRAAVNASIDLKFMREAEPNDEFAMGRGFFARGAHGSQNEPLTKRVADRTFYLIKDRWIEADYDQKIETKKIELFTKPYFALIDKNPEMAKILALGEQVIFQLDGTWYETAPVSG